jgi:hypothetical protein
MVEGEGQNLYMKRELSNDYIVGFTDGEGSFCVFVRKPKKSTWNTRIECHYYLKLREDDVEILKRIKTYLGCGRISFQKEYRLNQRDNYRYEVSNISDLKNIIIPFFRENTLQTKKKKDFDIFCTIVDMVLTKQHRTKKGIDTIERLKKKLHI